MPDDQTEDEAKTQRIVDLEEKVESLTFWSDKYSRWVAELHVVVDTIHACSGEGVTTAAEAVSDLFNRIADIEIAVSQLQGQFHAATSKRMDEARCNIRRRALAQMVHEKDGAGLDRSMYEMRVHGCQTQNAEKSKPSSGEVS